MHSVGIQPSLLPDILNLLPIRRDDSKIISGNILFSKFFLDVLNKNLPLSSVAVSPSKESFWSKKKFYHIVFSMVFGHDYEISTIEPLITEPYYLRMASIMFL